MLRTGHGLQMVKHRWRRLVREEGFEPSRGLPRQILSLMRLPFRHSRKHKMVEVPGLEPGASWSRTKRATKLRYTSTSLPHGT